MPWWWGGLWSVSLLVGVLVLLESCAVVDSRRTAPGGPGCPGSSRHPSGLRLHALVAMVANLGMLGAEGDPTTADLVGYAASAVVALVAAILATVCIRVTVDQISKRLHRGIAQGYNSVWLLPAERRLRAEHGADPVFPRPSLRPGGALRAERWTRAVLVWLSWIYATLCALPAMIATAVLLVVRPAAEPGPVTFLLILVWVPWALTGAILVAFLGGIRYPLDARRRLRVWMLGLLVAVAATTAWYLIVGTPFFGGFRWGLDVLLIVQGLLLVAIAVRIVVRPRR